MGREALRKDIMGLAVDDVVAMFLEKREIEETLGLVDTSSKAWIHSQCLDFINTEFKTVKLNLKGADVKKEIDRAVQEQGAGLK